MKRNKRRERRYSQKLNLDDMKKAIQIQKDIKVNVGIQGKYANSHKLEQFFVFQEDRLHQLRKAEGSLAQDSADCFRSWIVLLENKGVNDPGNLNYLLDETIFRAVRGILLTPIILSRILIRLHLLFKFEIKIIC